MNSYEVNFIWLHRLAPRCACTPLAKGKQSVRRLKSNSFKSNSGNRSRSRQFRQLVRLSLPPGSSPDRSPTTEAPQPKLSTKAISVICQIVCFGAAFESPVLELHLNRLQRNHLHFTSNRLCPPNRHALLLGLQEPGRQGCDRRTEERPKHLRHSAERRPVSELQAQRHHAGGRHALSVHDQREERVHPRIRGALCAAADRQHRRGHSAGCVAQRGVQQIVERSSGRAVHVAVNRASSNISNISL